MKRAKFVAVWLVVLIPSVSPTNGVGAELSGYLTLTTDYVYRGVTNSDGDPSVQLGGDVSFANSFYAGLW